MMVKPNCETGLRKDRRKFQPEQWLIPRNSTLWSTIDIVGYII